MEPYRPLDEVLAELSRVFSEGEIDRLLRQVLIRQAESAPADRDYLLERLQHLPEMEWEEARPIVLELLRILAHLVASVETLWATVARLEQQVDRLLEEPIEETPEEWEE